MRRKTFDTLLSLAGVAVTVLLLVAGGLLTWASTFVGDQVHDQLAAQKITMPAGEAIDDPAVKPYLEQYAGQQLTTGAQAKAFADHYILVHMNASSGGRTYEEVSGEYIQLEDKTTPEAQELGQLRQTLFMGNTLRGLLLNAYAFATIGVIAGYAAVAAFVGAALFGLLSALGFVHRARTAEDAELLLGAHRPAPVEV